MQRATSLGKPEVILIGTGSYPGPSWPAVDEVYNDFVICDMMAKAAIGQMTAEESVKWATQQSEGIFKKWHGT